MNPYTHIKSARYTDFDLQGPQSIDAALSLLFQAKALAKPPQKLLNQYGLSEKDLMQGMRYLSDKTHPHEEKFRASDYAPDPKTRAVMGGLGGAGLGVMSGSMSGQGALPTLALGALAASAGAGGAYLQGARRRRQVLNTMKLLRAYGINSPRKMHQARPLFEGMSN